MRTQLGCILVATVFLFVPTPALTTAQQDKKLSTAEELVRESVQILLKLQEKGGQWAYHCQENAVKGEEEGIPTPFRVSGTAVVAEALMFAAPDDKEVQAAVQRALPFVLEKIDHPKMATSVKNIYDVRIWGQFYALEFLCHVRALKMTGEHTKKVDEGITRLVQTLIEEEMPGGGWTYGRHRGVGRSFVTAPVVQALLLARAQGEKVPDALLERARKTLEIARTDQGAFVYDGASDKTKGKVVPNAGGKTVGGSAARSTVCENTLVLLGGGSVDAVRGSIDIFWKYWDDLAKRRAKPGTHAGKYDHAPYYFYFGHRYVAQGIQLLPDNERAKERERLLKAMIETRNQDSTWNDRVYPRSRNVGTALVVVTLLGDRVPLPPRFAPKVDNM